MKNSRLIDTFFNLVQIDSPTGLEDQLVEFIINFLNENELVDYVTKDTFGNVYARVGGEGDSIFFTDHLDTVEPGRGVNPQVKNGYITSDGTTILGADDKSSVAAVLETLFVLKESKQSHKTLEIIFTISEEVGNLGAVNFDLSLLNSKNGYCFDCSLPLGAIITQSPFYERFDIQLIGKDAHASRPELGTNTLIVLQQLLNKLTLGKIDPDTIFNIGVVSGGTVRNAVPGQMSLQGEIRSFNEQKLIQQKKLFQKVLTDITTSFGAKYKADFVRENPGYVLDQKKVKKQLTNLTQIYQKNQITPNLTPTWGVSDTNIFNNKGLTCINTGGGREFAHTTRERVKISELEKLVHLMLELVKE